MQLFFTDNIQGNNAILNEEETRHCAKVLRKKVGDIIHFIDGKGGFYKGEITDLNKKDCRIHILHHEQTEAKNFSIHIAIAPTKNISRTEWFIEKCTEIGIDEITFLHCEHSERNRLRLDRLQKVALSATKQSLKAFLPQLNDLISFKDFIHKIADNSDYKYICWVSEQNLHLLKNEIQGKDVIILIGPEGDFSKKEIELAQNNGFSSVSLGKSRLRTETAGVVACHLIHVLNEL